MITEKKFKEICAGCNRLLMLPESTLETVAIPWLHVIREHPIVLENYTVLYNSKTLIQNIKDFISQEITWFRLVYRTLGRKSSYWFGSTELPQNVDILIISHIVNPFQFTSEHDFYFSNVPSEIMYNGKVVLIAGICHFDNPLEHYNSSSIPSKIPKVFFTDKLSLKDEMGFRRRLRREARRLRTMSKIAGSTLEQRILNVASTKCLEGGAQNNLRLFDQVKRLVGLVKPKMVLTLYEGHAHERMIFSATREVNKFIKRGAYQHTGIFKLSNAVRNFISSNFNPDLVYTSGLKGKKDLEKGASLGSIPILVLGSNRGVPRDLAKLHEKDKNNRVLVLPEGLITECETLMVFSLKAAILMPHIEFVWRLHPIISFDTLRRRLKLFKNLPSNITLSTQSFDDDLVNCKWCLYRGTTAVFKAVICGLRPIYYKGDEPMTIDPLFEIGDWRAVVETEKQLKEVFHQDYDLLTDEMQKANEYCSDWFSEFDNSVLINSLN